MSSVPDGSLAEAFAKEHHEIDAAIEKYMASTDEHPELRAKMLLEAVSALRRHIFLEEEVVFPHLTRATLMMPLMVMDREHGELWRRMDALEVSLQSGSADEQLATDCQELLSLLENHNSKEEPIIYPQMDTALSVQEQQQVAHLLAGGVLPEDWICQDA
ncbi:hemerythrin domain-containing protein [Glutamicibacter sp.]|uniref:hemerythrin domain-containing protein n=1 Tax=Glutamicibacter sp. TaxID=1931995 RepID=UPI002B45F56F|nr:hemerythrin domain-containing protein [Glutamicibacter sp.]HJX78513.1 hemerythrin domain-containing protein [Glutamicibacter sp.]